jgi:ABC-type lipoprotein release transport system permease subunit
MRPLPPPLLVTSNSVTDWTAAGVGNVGRPPRRQSVGTLLDDFLWNVSPTDVRTLSTAAAVLLGVAALASWLPAYRASRTDPLEVLRSD